MDADGELTVHIEDTDGERVLRVDGPIDLATAAVLRQALADALQACAAGEAGRSAVIDLAGVTAVDLCGVQLVCSAHRTFIARCASLQLRRMPEWFQQAAQAAGFATNTSICPRRQGDECLWRI